MEFYIHPQIRIQHTEMDFLEESGTLLLNVDWNAEKIVLVAIKIEEPEFAFLLSVQDGDLVFQRNETISVHEAKEHISKDVWINFSWEPEFIKTSFWLVEDLESRKTCKIKTPFTLPPPEILQYARETDKIPTKSYPLLTDFSNQVVKSIQLAQVEINQTSAFTNFWDTIKDSGKITERVPKDEVVFHNTIHSLIFNYCLKNSISIEREKHTAIGDIDFVFHTIVDGAKVEIPCEVKKAHSNDLLLGYETQLPTYMAQLGAKLGIYLIVGFSGEWFEGESLDNIIVNLELEADYKKTENIRVLTLDVSKPTPVSKRK